MFLQCSYNVRKFLTKNEHYKRIIQLYLVVVSVKYTKVVRIYK